jgi:butyryl-CoA dehydrogenase
MSKNFEGKVAVITGAGSGIGRALATELAQAGARLALTDVDTEGLEATRRLCGEAECRTYTVDVASRDQMFELAERVQSDFGTAHYIFNNAGVYIGASVNNSTIEEFEWVTNINQWGVIYGTKSFLPMLLDQEEGHIVNISSVFGMVGYPSTGAYCVSKFAVRGLTETLWHELEGTGVYATSVHPAGTRTGFSAAPRMGEFADDTDRENVMRQARGQTTAPEQAARKILAGVAKRKRRITVSNGSNVLQLLPRLFPSSYPTLMRWLGA